MKKHDSFEQEFVITEKIYRGFIEMFSDRNPLHTNSSFAVEKGFKSEVMHGNILGGFLSYFIGECLPIKNVIIHSQEIKYQKPVYLDQILLLKVTINDIFASVNVVEFKYHFENKIDRTIVAKGKLQIGII